MDEIKIIDLIKVAHSRTKIRINILVAKKSVVAAVAAGVELDQELFLCTLNRIIFEFLALQSKALQIK